MGSETHYTCQNCGFEHVSGGEDKFFYDEESNAVKEYMLLMMTSKWLPEYDIGGYIETTYCNHCKKKVKTYVITETGNYSDDEAKNRVEEAIKYKPFQKLVKFDDDEECIICPNCNQKILSFFTIDTLCPKCGSNFSLDYELLIN